MGGLGHTSDYYFSRDPEELALGIEMKYFEVSGLWSPSILIAFLVRNTGVYFRSPFKSNILAIGDSFMNFAKRFALGLYRDETSLPLSNQSIKLEDARLRSEHTDLWNLQKWRWKASRLTNLADLSLSPGTPKD
jgi:hypothetical protein